MLNIGGNKIGDDNMSDYPEILCNTIINKDGKSYRVRQFGFAGEVSEEHHILIPTNKIVRTFKDDGMEDIAKRIILPLVK